MSVKRTEITVRLITADVVAVVAAFIGAYLLRFHSGWVPGGGVLPPLAPYAALLPVVAVFWPLVFGLQRLYRPARGRRLSEETVDIALSIGLATLVLFGLDATSRLYQHAELPPELRFQYSRWFIALFLVLDLAFTVAARGFVRARLASRRRRGINIRRALVIGAGDLGRTVADTIHDSPQYGYHVTGFVDDDDALKGATIAGLPVLGTTEDVLELVRRETISVLFIALPWKAHDRTVRILDEAAREDLDVKIVPDLLQFVAFRAGFEDLEGIPLLNLADDPLSPGDRFLKRAFDMAGAGFGLLVLSPVLTLLAVLVRRSSPGPILYRQERTGLDGGRFSMYKFRTMNTNAEAGTGPVFAEDDDPRATPVGQRMRRHSLDELPQLWNVLRGDMSLVGPRPERPSFVEQFREEIPHYMLRHRMKTGMTGWAQVNGWRGNTSMQKRIEYDLYYLRHWSLVLDLKIVLMTLWISLRRPRRPNDPTAEGGDGLTVGSEPAS